MKPSRPSENTSPLSSTVLSHGATIGPTSPSQAATASAILRSGSVRTLKERTMSDGQLEAEKRYTIANEVGDLLEPPVTPFKLKLIHRKLNLVMSAMTKLESRAREGDRLEREVRSLQRSLRAERSRRVLIERTNAELQEQVDDLGEALTERVKNLEQYEEAARRALETKEDFEKQLNERRQTLENEEDKLRSSVGLVKQLQAEVEEKRREAGDARKPLQFDKRRRTSAAIRLEEEKQRNEMISLSDDEAGDANGLSETVANKSRVESTTS